MGTCSIANHNWAAHWLEELSEAGLADPRFVTLAKSVACYFEAFSRYQDVDWAIYPADRKDDKPRFNDH